MSGGGSAAGGYVIERSLRCNAASSQNLSFVQTAGDTQKFTVSVWVKRGILSVANQGIWGAGNISAGGGDMLGFDVNDTLIFWMAGGGSGLVISTRVFRDPSAFYHIVLAVDTTQATAANRVKIYINGVQETLTGTQPSLNYNFTFINTNGQTQRIAQGYLRTFDGNLAEFRFVGGQQLTPSSFAETNTATDQWVAKRYTGTYGTNGSYLDFKDGTSTTTLGQDKSGNNNHWTLTNFTRSAGVNDCWMLDVPAGNGSASAVQPSGNYAVLNPLENAGTFSKANLGFSSSTTQTLAGRATFAVFTGKWYWEITCTGAASNAYMIGVSDASKRFDNASWASPDGWAYYGSNGQKYTNSAGSAYGVSYTVNDIIGVALDLDNGTLTFYKLGVTQGVAYTGLAGKLLSPYLGNATITASYDANFGQRAFAYTPPTGFKALCTANLPVPSIKKPSDHFKVQLSTGANIKTDSEALFTNELEWIKDRANTNNHQLIDSVRGSSAVLQSNTTAAETTYTAPSGSSVGWVWRASDSAAVSNTNGSITSQVSANVAAGFSIVTYTGNGSTTIGASASTVGHGLGITPQVVLVKRRGATENWVMQHASLSPNGGMFLNTTNAFTSGNFYFSHPSSSSTFSVTANGSNGTNASTATYVAYCFAEIPGYSKFGSYTGNGSADGTNVTLGFRPRFIMFKRTDAASAWVIYDASRDIDNPSDLYMQAQSSAAEASAVTVDLNSNGFKLRTTGDPNVNGGTYIYMAFAESPFQYANAR